MNYNHKPPKSPKYEALEKHLQIERIKIRIMQMIVFVLSIGVLVGIVYSVNVLEDIQTFKDDFRQAKYALQIIADNDLQDNPLANNVTQYQMSGSYDANLQRLRVFGRDRVPSEVRHDTDHELGHYMWDLLTDDQRHDYKTIFNQTDTFVTEYAKKRAEEDFCETFSESLLFKMQFNDIPADRRDFFRNNIDQYTK